MTNEEKVLFDPGFSPLISGIPREAMRVFDAIAKLKQQHQKRFEFQRFDAQVSEMIKRQAGFYVGCILWGAYLHYLYKDNPRQIIGNPMLRNDDADVDYMEETRFVTELIEKLNKSANYYLRTDSKAGMDLIPIFEAYSGFAALNDNFKHLDTTDKIKLPKSVAHIENYSIEQLNDIKDKIYEAINAKKPELLLDLKLFSC
jgi:hypothetical protein